MKEKEELPTESGIVNVNQKPYLREKDGYKILCIPGNRLDGNPETIVLKESTEWYDIELIIAKENHINLEEYELVNVLTGLRQRGTQQLVDPSKPARSSVDGYELHLKPKTIEKQSKKKQRVYYIDRSTIDGVRKEVEVKEDKLTADDLMYLWNKLIKEFETKYPPAIQVEFARNMAHQYQQYLVATQLTQDAIKQQNENSNSEDTNTKGEE